MNEEFSHTIWSEKERALVPAIIVRCFYCGSEWLQAPDLIAGHSCGRENLMRLSLGASLPDGQGTRE